MSTQPVSNSIFQELQSFYQSRGADLKQLGSALQAGDLAQAQQVYSALVALGQGGPFSNSEPFALPGRADAFEAVGQALQSGDLAGAQAAFAKLPQTPNVPHHGDSLVPAYVVTIGSTQGGPLGPPQQESFWSQRKDALDQLGAALQSGDTAATQQAYDALVALGQNGPLRNGATFHRADRAQDFAAIGQALQSGDLAGAQTAFAALEDTFKQHSGPPVPSTVPTGPQNLLHSPSSVGGGPNGIDYISHHPPSSVGGGPNGIDFINHSPSSVGGGPNGIDFINHHPPSSVGGGPNGIDFINRVGHFHRGHGSYQAVQNLLESDSNSAVPSSSVSLKA